MGRNWQLLTHFEMEKGREGRVIDGMDKRAQSKTEAKREQKQSKMQLMKEEKEESSGFIGDG